MSRALFAWLIALAACGPQSTPPASDEGKACAARSDCVEVCANVCSAVDAGTGTGFHCTSFNRAINACLCGITVDGQVKPVGC